MKTRCPCCGAENSLDALLAHEEARQAVWAVAQINGELGRLAVQYIALFRPSKTALTFDRMAKLLGEIQPDMERGAINRDRVEYPAPPEAWIYGFREMLSRRNAGCLKLPLKSHGYLYEVMSSWQGQGLVAAPPQDFRQPENSQTLTAAMQLQGLRR
ncbi:hypothetical protein [Kingella kingae]|uniref:hypothetical protein n=1 Tax=Kingella kingae TaxID=504 RepID=UPI000705B651|nr:conserved protein of unknown function [Kingella kingae]